MRRYILILALILAGSLSCSAMSYTVNNAPEIITIGSGEGLIQQYTSDQINSGTATAVEQQSIDFMNGQIMNWQNKYSTYLKSAKFGEAIANACSLFADGVNCLRSLNDVYIAVQVNPQGTLCAGVMSNLYMETFCDFVNVYTILKKVIKGSGPDDMLDGSKRMRLLWQATDILEELNSKLRCLAMTITVTSFEDVWNAATAGMIDKDHGQLATEAFRRWKRTSENVSKFMDKKFKSPLAI